MKVFCDTSVLVAASVRQHPHFPRAHPVLAAIAKKRDEGFISAHSLAETYSALTMLPVQPRLLPADAARIVEANLKAHFKLVTVTAPMYARAIDACVRLGLLGGHVYDALLLECARQTRVGRIYTFDLQDFRRLAPDLADRIAAP